MRKNICSSFDEFLSGNAMTKKMHTSRAALIRLLDENDTGLTLTGDLLAWFAGLVDWPCKVDRIS